MRAYEETIAMILAAGRIFRLALAHDLIDRLPDRSGK